jgi:hypothetical protein
MKGDINSLVGKEVEVIVHGIIYRGKLIELGEEELFLKCETGWVTIMTPDVSEIREPDKTDKRERKFIDKDFFTREY